MICFCFRRSMTSVANEMGVNFNTVMNACKNVIATGHTKRPIKGA